MFRGLLVRGFLSGLIIAVLAVVLTPMSTTAQIGGSQNQQFTLGTRPKPGARKPVGQLNTLNDLIATVSACWRPPALEHAYPGMRMTMRFSFSRDGKLIGPPLVTYATPDVTPKTREIYRDAMLQSLESCTPLDLTSGLGGAIAGRPFVFWIVDERDDSRIKPRV
jgi:hypothetical protein